MTQKHPVYALADRFVAAYAALRPIDATFAGIDGHDHAWGDLGPRGVEAVEDLLRRTRRELGELPPAEDRWSQLAVRVLDDELRVQLESHDHDDPLRDIAHVGSTVPEVREALEVQDGSDAEGRRAIIHRLTSLPAALEGWRETIDLGRRRNTVVARRQVRSIAAQLGELAADGGPLRRVGTAVVAADGTLADEVDAALPSAQAAAEQAARWLLDTYLLEADEHDRVGEERYRRAARRHLGTDLDLEETYGWAWDRIGELSDRARRVARELSPDTDLPDTIERLRQDPTFAAPHPDAFREAMLARQVAALDALDGVHFDVPEPIRRVQVKLGSGGALGAYYTGPSEDFSRPGTIWWTLPDDGPVPLYEEVSTAYHEGFPGHHLQVGTQIGLADRLSRAHRTLIWNPGYGEGWALYTEQLVDELGLLEHPAYVLGYLTSELLRAVRVVVDLGLHLDLPIPANAPLEFGPRWDFDRAVAALEQLTFIRRDYAVSEITRYLGWPAQAISYAVGQRTIVELRDQRRHRDGAAFDLKAFHADVLGSGPVGLDLLREVVLG